MEKGRPGIDIVNEVLEHCLMAYHHSSFLISLYQQYQKRGSLSKKQLQGLFGKAKEVKDFPAGKLATLEALINKMPTRFKSEPPAAAPLYREETDHRGRLPTWCCWHKTPCKISMPPAALKVCCWVTGGCRKNGEQLR